MLRQARGGNLRALEDWYDKTHLHGRHVEDLKDFGISPEGIDTQEELEAAIEAQTKVNEISAQAQENIERRWLISRGIDPDSEFLEQAIAAQDEIDRTIHANRRRENAEIVLENVRLLAEHGAPQELIDEHVRSEGANYDDVQAFFTHQEHLISRAREDYDIAVHEIAGDLEQLNADPALIKGFTEDPEQHWSDVEAFFTQKNQEYQEQRDATIATWQEHGVPQEHIDAFEQTGQTEAIDSWYKDQVDAFFTIQPPLENARWWIGPSLGEAGLVQTTFTITDPEERTHYSLELQKHRYWQERDELQSQQRHYYDDVYLRNAKEDNPTYLTIQRQLDAITHNKGYWQELIRLQRGGQGRIDEAYQKLEHINALEQQLAETPQYLPKGLPVQYTVSQQRISQLEKLWDTANNRQLAIEQGWHYDREIYQEAGYLLTPKHGPDFQPRRDSPYTDYLTQNKIMPLLEAGSMVPFLDSLVFDPILATSGDGTWSTWEKSLAGGSIALNIVPFVKPILKGGKAAWRAGFDELHKPIPPRPDDFQQMLDVFVPAYRRFQNRIPYKGGERLTPGGSGILDDADDILKSKGPRKPEPWELTDEEIDNYKPPTETPPTAEELGITKADIDDYFGPPDTEHPSKWTRLRMQRESEQLRRWKDENQPQTPSDDTGPKNAIETPVKDPTQPEVVPDLPEPDPDIWFPSEPETLPPDSPFVDPTKPGWEPLTEPRTPMEPDIPAPWRRDPKRDPYDPETWDDPPPDPGPYEPPPKPKEVPDDLPGDDPNIPDDIPRRDPNEPDSAPHEPDRSPDRDPVLPDTSPYAPDEPERLPGVPEPDKPGETPGRPDETPVPDEWTEPGLLPDEWTEPGTLPDVIPEEWPHTQPLPKVDPDTRPKREPWKAPEEEPWAPPKTKPDSAPDETQQPWTVPQPFRQPYTEPDTETETETQTETETDVPLPVTTPHTKPDTRTEPGTKTAPATAPQTEPDTKTKTEPDTKTETETQPKTTVKPDVETKVDTKTVIRTGTRTKTTTTRPPTAPPKTTTPDGPPLRPPGPPGIRRRKDLPPRPPQIPVRPPQPGPPFQPPRPPQPGQQPPKRLRRDDDDSNDTKVATDVETVTYVDRRTRYYVNVQDGSYHKQWTGENGRPRTTHKVVSRKQGHAQVVHIEGVRVEHDRAHRLPPQTPRYRPETGMARSRGHIADKRSGKSSAPAPKGRSRGTTTSSMRFELPIARSSGPATTNWTS